MTNSTKPAVLGLAISKGKERYLWLFRPDTIEQVRRSLGRFASDPDLDFSWSDASKANAHLTAMTEVKP